MERGWQVNWGTVGHLQQLLGQGSESKGGRIGVFVSYAFMQSERPYQKVLFSKASHLQSSMYRGVEGRLQKLAGGRKGWIPPFRAQVFSKS